MYEADVIKHMQANTPSWKAGAALRFAIAEAEQLDAQRRPPTVMELRGWEMDRARELAQTFIDCGLIDAMRE